MNENKKRERLKTKTRASTHGSKMKAAEKLKKLEKQLEVDRILLGIEDRLDLTAEKGETELVVMVFHSSDLNDQYNLPLDGQLRREDLKLGTTVELVFSRLHIRGYRPIIRELDDPNYEGKSFVKYYGICVNWA